MERYVIVLAGGRGERFWPVSREQTPKQFLKLLGERSFLQQTVDRVEQLVPSENVLVITNAAHVGEVRKQLPKLPRANVVGEPVGRDTCAAVTLGAAVVGARSTTAVMAVLPADHMISEVPKFRRVLEDSFELAGRGQVLVTIGIQPTEPATGYGYIKLGPELPAPAGAKRWRTVFFKAEAFREKPDAATAQAYVESGHYRWNAGLFVWSFVSLTGALERHQPELHAACERWFAAAGKGPTALGKVLAREYPAIRRISVDYAVLEQAHNIVCADGAFGWDDVGTWPALARHLKTDGEGNAAVGELWHVDAARNVVFDARRRAKRTPICLVGLRDTVVVQTDDVTLVASKQQAQQVKELVNRLARDPARKALV
jgi:mannose-1-phosphate guanylyltransferase